VKAANLALAFLIELATLAGFGAAGLALPLAFPWPWLAAAVAVGIGIGVWAIWAAPRSRRRLTTPALTWFKAAMFALGVAGLAVAGQGPAAVVLGLLAALHLVLAVRWDQV
jgi:hypothetical protein